MKRKIRRRLCENAFSAAELVDSFLAAQPKGKAGDLTELWRHWPMVMGAELAGLAHPLGARGTTLLVGAEDNAALQELAFMTEDILERVNAFLDQSRIDAVHLSLLQGRRSLDRTFPTVSGFEDLSGAPRRAQRARPSGPLGNLDIDPNSPVGRIYWKYVSLFEKQVSTPGSATKVGNRM